MISENKDMKFSLDGEIFCRLLGVDGLIVDRCSVASDGVTATVRSSRDSCECPYCGRVSRSVHSIYERSLMSLPVSALRMAITFRARRFRCANARCKRKTFAEQVEDLTWRYSRITVGVRRLIEKGLPEMSAVKCSHLSAAYGIPRSPSTCLRMTYRMPLPRPDPASVRRVRIDDFALRKGQEYGTSLMDADTGKVIGMVAGRSTEAAERLLAQYRNVEVISRDRSGAYASAASSALPGAIQVADRFHLVKNCGDSLAEQIKESRASLIDEVSAILDRDIASGNALDILEKRAEVMSRAYYPAIAGLYAKGMSVDAIARKRHYDRAVVRECVRECRRTDEEVKSGLAAGLVAGRKLRLYLTDPSHGVRKGAGERTQEHMMMERVVTGSPTLSAMREYVSSFRSLFKKGLPDSLDEWVDKYRGSPFRMFSAFAKGLKEDRVAIRNAINNSISNGPLEGVNNKLKAIKRSMYGRAGIALLLRKMILSVCG